MEKAVGTNTSVHIGSFMHDYENMLMRDPQLRGTYTSVGTGGAVLANRISWFYNLKGPSLMVDTACSSSLTALHLACQGLRSGESDMGLVGGCNVFFDPAVMADIQDMGILSPTGVPRCFDRKANGYSRGEGIGMVVLKRLSDALEAGDCIRGVIRATGIGSDGWTPGITRPSGTAQASLIRKVYEEAGLDPSNTMYFEAHGTGAPVGDLLEARAIQEGMRRSQSDPPLYVGAVKSNIGHLEGAAGIAGFIKTVLTLEKGIIPPNLWFEEPNRKILCDEWNIKFPTKATPWPVEGLRRASQNSFGFGGSNAHAVVDDAANYLRLHNLAGRHRTCTTNHGEQVEGFTDICSPYSTLGAGDNVQHCDNTPRLLVWSASDNDALTRLIARYEAHFTKLLPTLTETGYLERLSYTLSEKRSNLPWRTFHISGSLNDLKDNFPAGLVKHVRSTRDPRLGFVFTGQGAQWALMGLELLEIHEYRSRLEDADRFFRKLGSEWSLLGELQKVETSSRISNPLYAQPVSTVVQTTLVDLLSHWGIKPSVVVGHSSGEIAAAYCAGAISRQSAWTLAYYRGLVSAGVLEDYGPVGTMVSIDLSEAEVAPLLPTSTSIEDGEYATVACINSPKNVTVSGSKTAIDNLCARLEVDNVPARRLQVDVAYHSRYMANAASKYERLIHNIQPQQPCPQSMSMVSSVTGLEISFDELCKPEYWVRNMTSPVRFSDAAARMCVGPSADEDHFSKLSQLIEIGPHSALRRPLREILNAENLQGDIGYSSLLMRGQNAIHSTLNVAGLLHCSGYPVDLYKVNRLDQSRTKPSLLPDLPQYPFDHSRRYWLEGPNNKAFRFRKHNSHEILGIPAADWNEQEPRWCNSISMSSASWIQDHQVNNTVVFPAAGMITMAIEAATQIADSSMQIVGFQLQDVVFRKALIIPATGSVATQLSIQASSHENTDLSLGRTFRVYFSEGDEWVEACEGRISIEYGETQPVDGQYNGESNIGCASGFQEESLAQTTAANVEELYTRFKTIGLEYGPAFQRLHDVHVAGNGHATARVNLFNDRFQKADDRTQRYAVHPAALDVMLQVALVSLTSIKDHNFSTPVISRVPSLYIPSTGLSTEDASIEIRARCEVRSERAIDAAFHGSKTSNPTLRVNGSLQITSLEGGPDVPSTEHPLKQFCHKVAWKPDPNLLNKDSTLDYCLRGVTGTKKPHFSVMTEEKLQLILLTILDARDAGPDLEKLFHEKPWFRTYFEWIEHAISVNLGGNNDGHVAIAELKAKGADKQSMTQIHDQVLATGSSGELLVRVAKNHAAMLKGSVDPLTLLFGDGLMTEVYKELHDNNPAFGQLAVYLDVLAHQNPSAKVLEIGAGTGGTTKEILDTLACESLDDRSKVSKMPRFSEFVFTDISSVFFENAKERFSNSLDRMRFATLNIEKEPIDQGFEAASYDIIVASNVLHATANLSVTLENARKLLKPGGKLILYECVDPTSLFHNFVLGLLSGWWLSSEPERKYSPLVEESRWNTYLTDAGFSGIDLSFREHETDHEGGSSVMISTSPSAPVQPSNVSEVVIIADQTSQRQVGLADLVTSTLLETDHVECKMIELSHTTEDVLSEKTCITLLDMDQPFLDNVSDEKLEGLQTLFRAAKGIIWASGNSSSNPFRNLVTGLSRDQWLDRPDLKLVTVALEDPSAVSNCARHVAAIYHHSFLTGSSEYESDYSEQGGRLCISRLVNASSVNKHIHVQSGPPQPTPRVLSGQDRRALALDLKLYHQNGTIQFGEKEPADPLAPDEIEYVTKAISLDTTSLDRGESTIGQAITLGCAGVVRGTGENCALKIGDRICCLTNSGITTMGRCTASTAVQLPDELSFRDAASTPVDYCMAFLALDYWARIRTGDSVLVKSGATPAGQACIRYAGLFTDKVYVSVDNEEERKLIIEHLAVPQEHVLSARPSMLKDSIMSVTRGRGVSIMICPPGTTLSGRQVELLAPFGRLVQHGLREMGPSDLTAKNVMVATVNLAETINQNPALIKEALSTVMDLIRQRKLQPVSVPDTYNIANLATALASIKSARVSRRVAVELNAGETVTVRDPLPSKAA
jgi:acyl transferase domain-containing protein/NADPH:quinone reductase-like Zn-dependent oxidoreductase